MSFIGEKTAVGEWQPLLVVLLVDLRVGSGSRSRQRSDQPGILGDPGWVLLKQESPEGKGAAD